MANKNNQKTKYQLCGKKKIGNAVKRNKIKRRLRNIVNDATKKMTLNFKYSYLVIAKSTMLNSDYTNIKEILIQELKRLNNELFNINNYKTN